VLRCAADEGHAVVVEAVNLTATTAERDVDALASRLLRIREGNEQRDVRFVLGYVASPGGLNGEAVLKEWIEHKVGTPMFNLDREEDSFRDAAAQAVADLNDGLGVYRAAEKTEAHKVSAVANR
jgi:hypothetical protein